MMCEYIWREEELEKMLDAQIIRLLVSVFVLLVIIVSKEDKTFHLCADCRSTLEAQKIILMDYKLQLAKRIT